MKILTFPSEDYDREELDKLSQDELLHLWYIDDNNVCHCYANVESFQKAFNDGEISDEWFIYFID